jgi:glycosyltransferase involved in cell wall biosynthesis
LLCCSTSLTKEDTVKVSLIISTLNRHADLREILASLAAQTIRPHQVIIVDQNDNDLSRDMAESFRKELPILHIRQSGHGLSRGRNEGLKHVDGDIIAFPDDDCIYPSETIEKVVSAFTTRSYMGLFTGMSIAKAGQPSQGRWGRSPHRIDRYNVWISQTSYTTFYRFSALKPLGGFDESLGVGSGTLWGAGEETELMLRALKAGVEGHYDPTLKIVHPEPVAIYDDSAMARGRRYNRGFGRVLRLEDYPLWFVAYMVGRPLAGSALSLIRGRLSQARYRITAAIQRGLGWMDQKPE